MTPKLNCVLLVDDDEPTNYLHLRLVTRADCAEHIQVVTRGQQALDYLTCQGEFNDNKVFPQPGLILLDINMPGMNGWEFLEEYKKLPPEQQGEIVVAMLTTSLNPDDRKRAEELGTVSGFISKPLTLEALQEILRKGWPQRF